MFSNKIFKKRESEIANIKEKILIIQENKDSYIKEGIYQDRAMEFSALEAQLQRFFLNNLYFYHKNIKKHKKT